MINEKFTLILTQAIQNFANAFKYVPSSKRSEKFFNTKTFALVVRGKSPENDSFVKFQ